MKLTDEQLQELSQLIKQGYIRKARHPLYDLTIYNYTNKAQYEAYWTPLTRMCRGLVLDSDGKIVIKCPPKFFNRGEPFAADVDLYTARVSEKLDGFYITIKADTDYGLLVTSRGSFDSKYALSARKLITDEQLLSMPPNYTYFCELLQNFPEDEGIIVIEHPDPKLVCWAVMDPDFNEEIPDEECPFPIAKELSLAEAKEYLTQKVEGIVAQDLGTKDRVKIKTDWYVKMHSLISDCTEKRMWEALRDGLDITDLDIPDELYAKMDSYRTKLLNRYNILLDNLKRAYNANMGLTDKEIALNPSLSGLEKTAILSLRKNKHGRLSIENIVWNEVGKML